MLVIGPSSWKVEGQEFRLSWAASDLVSKQNNIQTKPNTHTFLGPPIGETEPTPEDYLLTPTPNHRNEFIPCLDLTPSAFPSFPSLLN